ncbi:HD domain-containing protein [Marichromatium gracile]|uniref:YfbR-like 5'-deoxynucleotidase n=1 Tax=Marichromatium TaxID=85076 RepID=UPI000F3F6B9F|nr:MULTISPECIES: YfbR-like 5'-deoxynucleotidase [Marichromatium]MBO8084759.1 HD domain-containing protein [Marichromatium sp.]MCF1184367.1 HD domain-containing protein [Marichromatium gracile]RNE88561.1 HD domain-containing protein [Marichromatium sp. AB31]RNE93694.1 HD domain-containing protein [Marichromatium sp. AB32]
MQDLKLNMRDIARSGHVTRWHSVRCARNQTLAEHHYLVAMITRELLSRVMPEDPGPEVRLQALEYALLHDAPELLMGDMPSPLKRRVAEVAGRADPLERIEREIAPEVIARKQALRHTPLAFIVKLADLMDACLFIREEGIGAHAAAVADKSETALRDKLAEARAVFPALDWTQAERLYAEMAGCAGTDNRLLFE